ncbi:LamG-like jellyroll fold domain-containing protein [Streptomyces sp. NPDC056909]|uniref:LamG domain-containing protein n=1 Tax=Streptomyces sp. NPDC056909 TaxID=3345963 RepID=UPI0036755653
MPSGAETHVVEGSPYTETDVIPMAGGVHTLWVEAKDDRGRWGPSADFTFFVALPTGPTGRWHFDDGVPDSGTTVAKDTATEGTRHDATLHTAGAGWSTMARRGEADRSLWLDSAAPAEQSAYAATSEPAVSTKDSFTLSTWVYLTDASTSRTVLSTPGGQAQAFALYYSGADRRWAFSHAVDDSAAPALVTSEAEGTDPTLNVWTHLAAVFDTHRDTDTADDTIQLYVNGRPQGTPVKLAASAASQNATYQPWTATGGLQFGRSVIRSEGGQYFRGLIDETAVWQRSLLSDEIRQEARVAQDDAPANELVARWDATTATGTEIAQGTPYPVPAMKLSATGAVLDDAGNGLTLDGTSGYAAAQGPVVDESGSFTVSARVRLNGQAMAEKPDGYRGQVAGQSSGGESSWALWVVKWADGLYTWEFTRTATDAAGEVTRSASVSPASELAETDTWVDVTGVFDAQEAWTQTDPLDPAQTEQGMGKLQLYIGMFPVESGSNAGFDAVQQGGGELGIGRGTAGGTTGHYFPGDLQQLRVWVGAMTANQVLHQVVPAATP